MMAGWVRVETRFISHPKVLDVGPLAEALWLRGLCYAGEQLTDGFIPVSFVKRMSDLKGLVHAAKLVDAGLWEAEDNGYRIHDYLEWQQSRDEVAEISSKRAEAGRRGGKQKASNMLANSQANAKQNASKTLADIEVDRDRDRDTSSSAELEGERASKPDPKPKPHRLPTNWQPTPEAIAWAVTSSGLPLDVIRTETEKFRDHFLANAKLLTDWPAAWRNWIRRVNEFQPTRSVARANAPNGRDRPAKNGRTGYTSEELERLARGETLEPTGDPSAVIDAQFRVD